MRLSLLLGDVIIISPQQQAIIQLYLNEPIQLTADLQSVQNAKMHTILIETSNFHLLIISIILKVF